MLYPAKSPGSNEILFVVNPWGMHGKSYVLSDLTVPLPA